MLYQTPAKPRSILAIASLDGARGGHAPAPQTTSDHAKRPSVLKWVRCLMASRKTDRLVLETYKDLYDADDHILRDVGVTRLEVAQLIERSSRR